MADTAYRVIPTPLGGYHVDNQTGRAAWKSPRFWVRAPQLIDQDKEQMRPPRSGGALAPHVGRR